ncbi:MAG: hypothetical protein ACYSYV_02250 [Planctomycetota bacterium]
MGVRLPPGVLPNQPKTTDDSTNTMNVRCSDKQNNKPPMDPDLAEIVAVWPELPDAICSAIVAIVSIHGSQVST